MNKKHTLECLLHTGFEVCACRKSPRKGLFMFPKNCSCRSTFSQNQSILAPCDGEPDAIGAGHLECQVATAAFRSPATSNFRGRSSGRGNIHRSTRRSDRSHGEPDAIGAGPLECQVATEASSSPSRFKGFGRKCMLTLTCLLGARTRICCHGTRQCRATLSKAFASRCTGHYRAG